VECLDCTSTEIAEIFQRMKDNLADLPLPEGSASKADHFDYFSEILPDYDEDRVMISDVKKVIKWFKFLAERDMLESEAEDQTDEKEESKKEEK